MFSSKMERTMKILHRTIIGTIIFLLSLSLVTAYAQTEPIGGKPSPGSKPSVPDLDYQVTYQRAFEAVLWSMPAIGIYGFHRASERIGAGPNVILAMSGPAKPNQDVLPFGTAQPCPHEIHGSDRYALLIAANL